MQNETVTKLKAAKLDSFFIMHKETITILDATINAAREFQEF